MPTLLTRADHLDGLRQAMLAFVRYADRAGLTAPVPTCPDWTVRDLVAHQGMVHRWATAVVQGTPATEANTATERNEAEGRRHPDPTQWLADGAIDLARALATSNEATTDLVFLADAPADPVDFWARRQCHETTIHAVDALSAALGRAPGADETWIGPELAGDGIDELLGGFLARPISKLRLDDPGILVVAPDDLDRWWRVEIGPEPARSMAGTGPVPDGDWQLTGTARDLYLRLWNRTGEAVTGPEDRLDWAEVTAVRWRRR